MLENLRRWLITISRFRKNSHRLLALICLFAQSLAAASQALQAPRLLSEGAVIEQELKAGEAHRYRVTLSADDYLGMRFTERGTDVRVRAYGPDGSRILEENT